MSVKEQEYTKKLKTEYTKILKTIKISGTLKNM